MKRIWLEFDEFFKLGMKVFLGAYKFIVETEFEIFKLPKKLDVLVVKLKALKVPKEFHTFQYFKEHNLISFKSPRDPINEDDFHQAIIYLHGYLEITKKAKYGNTTMTIFCNHTPEKYLKERSNNVHKIEKGAWYIDYAAFKIHLFNLNLIDIKGVDDAFLKDFASTNAFKNSISFQQNFKLPKKILDILKYFMYIRNASFEKLKIEDINMPVAMRGDITEMVQPFLLEAKNEGKLETEIKNAKAMKRKGLSDNIISEITGLSLIELKKYKIVKS